MTTSNTPQPETRVVAYDVQCRTSQPQIGFPDVVTVRVEITDGGQWAIRWADFPGYYLDARGRWNSGTSPSDLPSGCRHDEVESALRLARDAASLLARKGGIR